MVIVVVVVVVTGVGRGGRDAEALPGRGALGRCRRSRATARVWAHPATARGPAIGTPTVAANPSVVVVVEAVVVVEGGVLVGAFVWVAGVGRRDCQGGV